MLSNRKTVVVEMFAILGMSCSGIDDALGVVRGFAHDAVTDWWSLTKEGYECEAVSRWRGAVERFSVSGEDRQYVQFAGYNSRETRNMLDAMVGNMRLGRDMRAMDGGGRAWLERRKRRC